MKSFLSYQPEQALMLPPSLEDWMPEDHLARFIEEVTGELDLSEVLAGYEEDGRGQSAYHPLMMVRLLLYGYCQGTISSRVIERKTYEDVAFRYLAWNQHPDHTTIAEFRRRHREALANLFKKVLALCGEAGLVKLGHVALDGTKIKANASMYQTYRYEKLSEQEQKLTAKVEAMLAEAERVDAAEEEKYGRERRGDELPEGLRRKQQRLERIREGKARLEEQARKRAEEEKKVARQAGKKEPQGEQGAVEPRVEAVLRETKPAAEGESKQTAESKANEPPTREAAWSRKADSVSSEAKPAPEEKINLTDADSRMMKDRASKGWVQGYNVQAAVDDQAQVIVAADVTQDQNDRTHLCPLIEQVRENVGARPEKVSADTDYWSPTQVSSPMVEGIDLYIRPDDPPKSVRQAEQQTETGAPLRKKKPRSGYAAEGISRADAVRLKLKTPEGKAIYAKRREIVEPVFGQIKQRRGLRQFFSRGIEKVRSEWKLICLTHNLLKLYRYDWLPHRA